MKKASIQKGFRKKKLRRKAIPERKHEGHTFAAVQTKFRNSINRRASNVCTRPTRIVFKEEPEESQPLKTEFFGTSVIKKLPTTTISHNFDLECHCPQDVCLIDEIDTYSDIYAITSNPKMLKVFPNVIISSPECFQIIEQEQPLQPPSRLLDKSTAIIEFCCK